MPSLAIIAAVVVASLALAPQRAGASGLGAANADSLASLGTTGVGGTVPGASGKVVLGYFADWGVYDRQYYVKNLVTSGSASKITHINYAFGNVTDGRCAVGDPYADYDQAYTAANSVDGVGDTWDQPLRGSFNQLRKLKRMYPNIKILWSFGGWTWSGGFAKAAQDPSAFAKSCSDLVKDPRWADVFDGIDIDWEYPNACGLSCDTSGPDAFKKLMAALRTSFGSSQLVTAAVTADATSGGNIDATDYAGASASLDWYNVMTYDFFGAFGGAAQGPTAPHSPLTSYDGKAGSSTADAIAKFRAMGVPAGKLLVGIGFYGRGWTGVTQDAPGGGATGPAAGKYEAGIEDYKVLKATCPATGTIAGTAFAHCGSNWWSYDTPSTIATKMTWATSQGLRGAFFWEFSGDTSNGELVTAITSGLGSDNPDGDHDGSGTQDICPASGQTAPCLDGPGSGAAGGSPSGGGPGGGTVAAGSAGAGAARPAVTITVRPLSARVARGHRLRLRVSVGGAVNVGARRVAVSLSRRGGGRTLRRTVTVAPDAHGARVVTIGITIPKRAASGKYTSRASLLTGNSRVLARFTGRTIVRITR